MAAIHLLPGLGGKITYTMNAASNSPDSIDTSRCAQLIFQVTAHSGDGANIFINRGSFTLAQFATAVGTILRLPINSVSMPMGQITFSADGTTGSTTFILVGYEVQRES